MKFLLDTNAFLWAATFDPRLSARANQILNDASNDFYLSVVSLWEVTVKVQIGKLQIPQDLGAFLQRTLNRELTILPIQPEHVLNLSKLPLLHRDPFDRMLVAQSMSESVAILSSDRKLRQYEVEIIW